MTGKAESDEPFPVELPRCLFQQCNPLPVVLDQIVVGGEDVGDAELCKFDPGGTATLEPMRRTCQIDVGDCRTKRLR